MKALRWLAYSMTAVSLAAALPDITTDALARDGGARAGEVRLRAKLTGPTVNSLLPSGHADFRLRNNLPRINVEVENFIVPAGAVLTAFATPPGGAEVKLGDLKPESATSGESELELNMRDGDVVPPGIVEGTVIAVKQGATLVVSGILKLK